MVTGGAGFIGSALIRYILSSTDHSVVNIDKLTYAGCLESLTSVSERKNYKFEKADICDSDNLIQLFKRHQPDLVMHLAAESHVDRSIDKPGQFIQTNIVGVYSLLEAARQYYVALPDNRKENFRFHHVSTDEVYGDLPIADDNHDIDNLPVFSESSPYHPHSPYSASKAAADHLVRAWNRTYKLPVVISNCSNNYGAFQYPEKLIPLMILNALEGKTLPVYGSGSHVRDWIYVDDHVKALMSVATLGRLGETYNISAHQERTNLEVVHEVCDILDDVQPVNQSYKSQIRFVEDRPGHDLRYALDATKIMKELNWRPQEDFKSGLRKTVLWYLQNQQWCKKVQQGRYNRERQGTI